jgi:hypothetical protein
MTCPSCCCPACPAPPTGPGAPRRPPPGPSTEAASPGTAGCGPRTISPTSAPPPWTGSRPGRRCVRDTPRPLERDMKPS